MLVRQHQHERDAGVISVRKLTFGQACQATSIMVRACRACLPDEPIAILFCLTNWLYIVTRKPPRKARQQNASGGEDKAIMQEPMSTRGAVICVGTTTLDQVLEIDEMPR